MTIDPEVITRHFRSTSAATWSKKASDVWELVWPVFELGLVRDLIERASVGRSDRCAERSLRASALEVSWCMLTSKKAHRGRGAGNSLQ